MIPEGLRTGVDLGEGGLGAEAQPDDTGSHPLRQAQSRHDLTGLSVMTGGACGDADPLTAKIVYHILAGPARHGNGQDMGGLAATDDLEVRNGRQLFHGVGLDLCHVMQFVLQMVPTQLHRFGETCDLGSGLRTGAQAHFLTAAGQQGPGIPNPGPI